MSGTPSKPARLKPPTQKKNTNGRTGTASRAQAEKAIAELGDKPRNTTFRGVKLTLPSKMPATFAFDVAEMQAGNGTDLGVLHRLMVGFMGDDQWRAVRDKIASDGSPMDDLGDIITELFDSLTSAYGVSLGESSASDMS